MTRKDGSTVWVSTTARYILDNAGIVVGVEGTTRDITNRRRGEAQIERQQTQLVAAEGMAHLGSWSRDLATGELHWSDGFYRLMGEDPGTFTPDYEKYLSRIHPDDRHIEVNTRQSIDEFRDTYEAEYRFLRRDGEERFVHIRREYIYDDSGNPTQIVGTIQDITERKLLEAHVRQSQKMEAVGQLTGGASLMISTTFWLRSSAISICFSTVTTSRMNSIRRASPPPLGRRSGARN